jgi:putative colanic acid biosysnthesis UDP-glucose lipid carrier transferase
MNSRYIRSLQILMALLDVLTIIGLCWVGQNLPGALTEFSILPIAPYLSLYISVTWLLLALLGNIYSKRNILSFELLTKRSLAVFGAFGFLWVAYSFWFTPEGHPTAFIITGACSVLLSLSLNRTLYFLTYQFFKHKSFLKDKVILIGYNSTSKKIASYLEENEVNKEVIGFCDEADNVHELSNYPILGDVNHTLEVCRKFGVTEIYSSIAPEYNPEIYRIIQLADQHCIHFRFVPDINLFIKRPFHIDFWNDIPVLSLRKEPLQKLDNRILKALFDFAFSLCVVVFLLSWLLPLIGLLIWLDSGSPVFFTQVRTGKDNRKFTCLKFRSMKVNDQADQKQATRNDRRLTRVGKFLRHTNLDELPQFLNVLRGEMSVVGPRPHMLKHTMEYSEKVNNFMVRQFVKPGITGWAQVNGCRGEIRTIDKLKKRVNYDLWYLENWNLWLDLKIIFLTAVNVLKGDEDAF